jgi:hypothetical protein
LGPPVKVEQPLPPSLAFSDAAKIGQTAATAFWQADGGAGTDWVNAATGSSGTLQGDGGGDESCRPFHTTVTSTGGVHRYFGKICRIETGASVVQIAAPDESRSS